MSRRAALTVTAFLALAPLWFSSSAQSPPERPTADGRRATSTSERPTADGRRPTSTSERPTADGRRATGDLDQRTREVASELRCPVCQGESIQESPSPLAQEMKGIVREQLAAGKTPDEVKAYFVGRYGEWILLRPSADGVNLLLYWLPPLMLVGGVAVVLVVARRWTRAGAVAVTASSSPGKDA